MSGSQKIVYFKPENTAEVLNGKLCYLLKFLIHAQFVICFFQVFKHLIWIRIGLNVCTTI